MVTQWHIAQLNVASALYELDDTRMSRFVEQLDETNAIADASPGFVWRLQSDSGNAADIKVDEDPSLIINMSVWESVEALFDFAYKSAHRLVVADRRKWFARPAGAYQVLWWVKAGQHPSVDEALAKLAILTSQGPSVLAFDFKTKFPPPGHAGMPENLKPEPYCSGWE